MKKLGHHSVGDGIFGLSNSELQALNLPDKEKRLIKPYFTTDQIKRYVTLPNNNLWMIYTDSSYKNPNSLDDYPTIKKHLDQFIPIFTSDNKPYGLHRARNKSFFQGEKVICLRKCVGNPCFSYSDTDCYVTQTFYSIKTNRWNMKFLTELLNSRLIEFWLRNKGKMQGENFQLDKEPLLQIPLPCDTQYTEEIVRLVDQIIIIKHQNIDADIFDLENKINILVFHLYGLTYDEVKVIMPEILISKTEYDQTRKVI